MFNRRKSEYENMTKAQLKERLQVIPYEIASLKSKREIKKYYKEAELIRKQLGKIKQEELEREELGIEGRRR